MAATAACSYALVGDAVAAAGAAAGATTFESCFEGEAQLSVFHPSLHRVPPPPAAGLQDEGRGVHTRAGRGKQA